MQWIALQVQPQMTVETINNRNFFFLYPRSRSGIALLYILVT
jgi:hypothetical protein